MKSRKVIWLMIVVSGIWGTIGFKIYQGLNPDNAQAPIRIPEKMENTRQTKEAYSLILNYRDPFLGKMVSRNTPAVVREKRPAFTKAENTTISVIPWTKIEYMGVLDNTSRNSRIASLRMDSVDYMGKSGDIVNGFKIGIIYKDSIQLFFAKQKKIIKKK
jgi:hypothetical protein